MVVQRLFAHSLTFATKSSKKVTTKSVTRAPSARYFFSLSNIVDGLFSSLSFSCVMICVGAFSFSFCCSLKNSKSFARSSSDSTSSFFSLFDALRNSSSAPVAAFPPMTLTNCCAFCRATLRSRAIPGKDIKFFAMIFAAI